MSKPIRWALLILLGLLFLALMWFASAGDAEISALRNILQYKVVTALGGPRIITGQPPGALAGTIRAADGAPLAGATVLLSSPLGHAYTAETGAQGRYQINDVPPGRYVPVAGKRGFDDGLRQRCIAGLCRKDAVTIRPGTTTLGADLALSPAAPPDIAVNDSLVVSQTMEVEVGPPFPSKALRTHFSFERAGLRVNDCWLYEPTEGQGPWPTLLLVLPGPVVNWEMIPVPFATEGYSVLACYPLRGINIDEDAADLLTALEYLKQGRIPSRADTDRLALVGASFTSLHAYRLLGLTDEVDVTLVLGGMSDGFAFRHDVEKGIVHTRPPFGQVMMALGYPNNSPELYFQYSIMYHLEGLPPLCLMHGNTDELSPFSQSVELADELERRELPHEFYGYEGLSHYFMTTADDATTQQMFEDSLACLHGFLPGE